MMADDEPRAIEGEPKDPESTLVGAQFADATDGEPARALPKKKPPADPAPEKPAAKPDGDGKGDQAPAPASPPEGFNPEVAPDAEPSKSSPKDQDAAEDKPAEDKQGDPKAEPSKADAQARQKKSDADTGDEDVGGPEGASEHMVMTPKSEEGSEGKELVLFDFDGTLIEQDSLDLLLQEMGGGWLASRLKMIPAFFTAFFEAIMTKDDYMDYRSALKAHWMINTLAGKTVAEVEEASRQVAKRLDWRDKLKAAVSRYADEGREVVIASGAIDLCIKILLEGLPVTCLICTHAEVEDGVLTGRMAGKPKNSVNVVRGEKRYRVQKYIEERGPYKRVVGYGNLPSDGPMLSLCDEFFVI